MSRTTENHTSTDLQLILSNETRTVEWINKMHAQKSITKDTAIIMKQVIQCLEEIYPERWDMYVESTEGTSVTETKINWAGIAYQEIIPQSLKIISFQPVIYFPELIIKNSREETHTIKDLYVKFKIQKQDNSSMHIFGNLEGTRATVTLEEFIGEHEGYMQSHISVGTAEGSKWGSFCLGSGEILDLLRELTSGFSCELFQLFLFHVENMIKWESLEGNPYKYIRDYRPGQAGIPSSRRNQNNINRNLFTVPTNQIDQYTDNILTLKLHTPEVMNLELIMKTDASDNHIIEVKDDEALEDFLRLPNTSFAQYPVNVAYYRDEQGYYTIRGSTTPAASSVNPVEAGKTRYNAIINKNRLIFRGQRIPFVVTGLENNSHQEDAPQSIQPKIYIHPKIKENVREKLREKINVNLIRSSALAACY